MVPLLGHMYMYVLWSRVKVVKLFFLGPTLSAHDFELIFVTTFTYRLNNKSITQDLK